MKFNRSVVIKICVSAVAIVGGFYTMLSVAASNDLPKFIHPSKLEVSPPIPGDIFTPANTRTDTGAAIPSADFFSATRCETCHKDIFDEWKESLHRNAEREPFFKVSVDILQRQRGIEFTRHCQSCHAPISLVSGALTTGSTEPRTLDDEGVTCTVCHSIIETRLDGNGSFTIRRPALITDESGNPVYGDMPDSEIIRNIAGHKRAMMRDLLRTPEFCASCHKASAPPSLNNYKFLKSFSAYDEWQASGASTETLTPFYRRPTRAECRTCHMPPSSAPRDFAAKKGLVKSHRFLGANTITPLFYGQHKQAELTKEFLENDVLEIDIFAVENLSTGVVKRPIDRTGTDSINLSPGQTLRFDVVIANRKAAHSFPPEVRDLYEPWVEFEAIDANGKSIFHSGFINPDKSLDEKAHVYKSVLLDNRSRVITRHQIWAIATKAYDNSIPAGRTDLVRYEIQVPPYTVTDKLEFKAIVNYRRFNHEYTKYVLDIFNRPEINAPIVKMASDRVVVFSSKGKGKTPPEPTPSTPKKSNDERRWNDYGIALFEQLQFEAAVMAFKEAARLNPKNPDPLINAAISELRTERFSFDLGQVQRARTLLEGALIIDPNSIRAKFFQAIVTRAEGRLREAATELRVLADKYPRDREVRRELGHTLFSLGELDKALAEFQTVIKIDPNDGTAYQQLSALYLAKGQLEEAANAESLYKLWREDPMTSPIAKQFFRANPQWNEVRIPFHVKGIFSPMRPIAVGDAVTPDFR